MRTFIIIFLILTCLVKNSNGQITPIILRQNNIQNDILKNTNQFDSLIFADKSSYWKDDHIIQGIGFIKDNAYKVTISFKAIRDSVYRLEFKNLKKNKIRNRKLIVNVKELNISKLKSLNKDSLELKARTGTYMEQSDGYEWSLLIVYTKEPNVFLKQAYMPDIYVKTEDKQLFIDIVNKIELLFN